MNTATASTATPTEHSAPPWRPWPFRTPKWRQAIRQSELPSPTQTLLIAVVGGTGLLSDEKLEVAEELVAHFQDGLQRGRSASQLTDDFGDPQLAAQLIHNSKQRNRSMKNRLIQAAFWLSIIGIIGCFALVLFFYTGKPQPSTDYLAIFNQPILATAEEDKAWPIYRDLWIKYEFGEGGAGTFDEIYRETKQNGKRQLVRPSDGEKWNRAIEKLAACEDLLEGFREGGLRPSLGLPQHGSLLNYSLADLQAMYPTTYQTMARTAQQNNPSAKQLQPLGRSLAPHIFPLQKMPDLLVVDARRAIQQNDIERATRNLEAIFGLARQVSEGKFIMGGLSGLAFQSRGIDLIGECMQADVDFSQQQLERLHSAVKQCRIEEMVRFSAERVTFMDYIQHSYTDDGQGDGRITWAGLAYLDDDYRPFGWASGNDWSNRLSRTKRYMVAPTKLWQYASRKQMTEKAEEFFSRVDDFLFKDESADTRNTFESDLNRLPDSFLPIKRFFSIVFRIKLDLQLGAADQEGILAALAVLRYQRQHGHLPETLEELVGEFLDKTPRDPIDGQPLRYKVKGEDFLLYSVGTNQIDDGGQPDQGGDKPRDWILWPRTDD